MIVASGNCGDFPVITAGLFGADAVPTRPVRTTTMRVRSKQVQKNG